MGFETPETWVQILRLPLLGLDSGLVSPCLSLISFSPFFFFLVLGFELRTSYKILARQALYHLNQPFYF
jgi:hypothetical protein